MRKDTQYKWYMQKLHLSVDIRKTRSQLQTAKVTIQITNAFIQLTSVKTIPFRPEYQYQEALMGLFVCFFVAFGIF